jgi:hypothetical protein
VDVAGTFGSDRPERGWNIYREGDSVNYVYKVLGKAACTYKILVDGRRQTERSSVTVLA